MSETISSSSTMISPIIETSIFKTMLGTTVKLNGSNYLLWTQAFRLFIRAQNKLAYLLHDPPTTSNPPYMTWLTRDYSMMLWLLNSLEKKISGSVVFLITVKEMWDTLKVMYGNEKNPSKVFEIYERLFELKRRDRSMTDLYDNSNVLLMS